MNIRRIFVLFQNKLQKPSHQVYEYTSDLRTLSKQTSKNLLTKYMNIRRIFVLFQNKLQKPSHQVYEYTSDLRTLSKQTSKTFSPSI